MSFVSNQEQSDWKRRLYTLVVIKLGLNPGGSGILETFGLDAEVVARSRTHWGGGGG